MDYCNRKGVECDCLSENSVCNSDNCHRKLPDKKLTDSEITIKVLKEILEVMLYEGDLQRTSTISHTINLINRLEAQIGIYETCNARKDESIKHLEAEIKRLKDELYKLRVTYDCEFKYRKELHKRAKAKAYKEIKERLEPLKQFRCCILGNEYELSVTMREIDNLSKEMVGEDNVTK